MMRICQNNYVSKYQRVFRFNQGENGIALMIVLWVMMLLSIMASEFAFSMRTRLNIARNQKEETTSYYLAQAGLNQAIAEILNPEAKHHYLRGGKLVFGREPSIDEELEGEGTGEEDVAQRTNIAFGNGRYSYEIMDEEGKIDINKLKAGTERDRALLQRLLYYGAGIEEGTEREIIVDSILDWLDPDDLHRMNGAEDDYYLGLSEPYECKDGALDTISELLLVQGMTPEILYGEDGEEGKEGEAEDEDIGEVETPGKGKGIARYITVWSGGRFNRFTAESTVLTIKYGDAEAEVIADRLYDEEGRPLGKHRSYHFSIVTTGTVDGIIKRTIKAVVFQQHQKDRTPTVKIRYWNDNLIGEEVSVASFPTEREEPSE